MKRRIAQLAMAMSRQAAWRCWYPGIASANAARPGAEKHTRANANGSEPRMATLTGQAWCDADRVRPLLYLSGPCQEVFLRVTVAGGRFTIRGAVDSRSLPSGRRETFNIYRVPLGGRQELPAYRITVGSPDEHAPRHPAACAATRYLYGPSVRDPVHRIDSGRGPWPVYQPLQQGGQRPAPTAVPAFEPRR